MFTMLNKWEIFVNQIYFITLEMKEEYKSLVEELNNLSTNFEKNKERMVEIAKILLTDHYKYLPRNKNKNGDDSLHKLWQANWEEGE